MIQKFYEDNENFSQHLQNYSQTRLSESSQQLQLLNILYGFYLNKTNNFIIFDREIFFTHDQIYRLLMNSIQLFQNAGFNNTNVLSRFFDENLTDIIPMLEQQTNENNLTTKIVCFKLIEVMFLMVPIEDKKQLSTLMKLTLDTCKEECNLNETDWELFRLYKCFSYNALASIICNSVKNINFYAKLFVRDNENGLDILWNGLIDTNKTITFRIDFDTLPKQRVVLVNIRDDMRMARHKINQQERSNSYGSVKYLESQRLFNSSLHEDITKYDFTNTTIRSSSQADGNNDTDCVSNQSEIVLDAIDVNNHECMATVCGVIKQMFQTNIVSLPDADDDVENVVLPGWMKGKTYLQ